jgi:cytochrome b6-f complex iron-sulfur subunit
MSCEDCSRRSLLKNIALGAGALLVIGACGNDHALETSPDAGDESPDAPANPVSMCGGNLCIDVNQVAELQTVGGQFATPVMAGAIHDRIIIVRTSDTEFTTVSQVCTHAGCSVKFNGTNNNLRCPCHGSTFSLNGAVTHGPAARPLKAYSNSFDSDQQVLTITLA